MRPDGLVEDFIRVMDDKGANTNVTRKNLVLGSQDSEIGWYAKYYADTTIKMVILPRGRKEHELPAGRTVALKFAGFTASQVLEGDLIVDCGERIYYVASVTPHCVGDIITHYELDLELNLGHAVSAYEPGGDIIIINEPQGEHGAGYFKLFGEIWFWEPDLSNGGGYYPTNGTIGIDDPSGVDALGVNNGGAYFDR